MAASAVTSEQTREKYALKLSPLLSACTNTVCSVAVFIFTISYCCGKLMDGWRSCAELQSDTAEVNARWLEYKNSMLERERKSYRRLSAGMIIKA